MRYHEVKPRQHLVYAGANLVLGLLDLGRPDPRWPCLLSLVCAVSFLLLFYLRKPRD